MTPDKEVMVHTENYIHRFKESMGYQCGYTDVELTCLFEKLRTEETNIGNFFADLIATEFEADFGIFNGGGIRLNEVVPPGPIKFLNIQAMLPFPDYV